MAAWLQQRPFGFASVTPGKCQGTRGVGESGLPPSLPSGGALLSRCSVWAASLLLPSCGVRSNRCGFHFNPLIPQPFESEMAFHCCWSLISILRVCPHFYADELFLVCFASYYLLKSPYTSKPNFSEDPSACLAAPLSLPCGTKRPVCRLQPAPPSLRGRQRLPPCQVHGQYFCRRRAFLPEPASPSGSAFPHSPAFSRFSSLSRLPCRLTRAL